MMKKITLEQFMDTDSPYAVFVDCTEIVISPQDREKYLTVSKVPAELDDWCKDLILLGKREISILVKWRAKVRDLQRKEKQAGFSKIEYKAHDEEEELDPETELYKIEKKERRAQERLKEKKMLAFAKHSQAGIVQIAAGDLEAELADFDFDEAGDLMRKGEVYYDFEAEEAVDDERLKKLGGRYHEYAKKEVKPNSEEEVMDNLEYLYEEKRKRQDAAIQKHREKVQEKIWKKKKFVGEYPEDEDDIPDRAENALKMDRLDDKDVFLRKRALDETSNRVEVDDLRKSKWFDRDIFDVLGPRKKLVVQDAEDEEEDYGSEGEEEDYEDEEEGDGQDLGDEEAMDEEDLEDDQDEEDDDDEEDDIEEEDEEDESEEEPTPKRSGAKINIEMDDHGDEYEINAGEMDEEDMLKDIESRKVTKKDIKRLNRHKANEQREKDLEEEKEPEPIEEETIAEYDGRHHKGLTETQHKLLKTKDKEEKKYNKSLIDNTIKVVAAKKFEDFDPDDLAADLALAKKMIRKKDREEILDLSFNKFNNFDYEGLPSWFVDDEKKHHFLNLPVTKEEVQEMREELRAINERPIRKVLEAKFRKKHKLEKQLRKFKRGADAIFEEEGLDEKSKAKEVRKLKNKVVTADKNKNTKKKIIVGKKFKVVAPGKKTSGKKYRIVDSRSRKELRAEKRRKRNGNSGGKKGKRY
jgi:AdoMet-dependent rRNA methyltransferase SPB1